MLGLAGRTPRENYLKGLTQWLRSGRRQRAVGLTCVEAKARLGGRESAAHGGRIGTMRKSFRMVERLGSGRVPNNSLKPNAPPSLGQIRTPRCRVWLSYVR